MAEREEWLDIVRIKVSVASVKSLSVLNLLGESIRPFFTVQKLNINYILAVKSWLMPAA